MAELEAQDEIRALRNELALLRGEAQPEPTKVLEGPAEVLQLAAKAKVEDALLPEFKPDLSLDDAYVVQAMIMCIRTSREPFVDANDVKEYEAARKLVMELLSLRLGQAKLLWTRRDVHEVFRRSGSILEREVRQRVEAGGMP